MLKVPGLIPRTTWSLRRSIITRSGHQDSEHCWGGKKEKRKRGRERGRNNGRKEERYQSHRVMVRNEKIQARNLPHNKHQ